MTNVWLELSIVILSLGITLLVGLYFSKDGRTSLIEYMLGSRKMTVLPISLSMAATYLTGSTMVSSAQEVYMFGLQPSVLSILNIFGGAASAWLYLPVSYSIKSASSFQYFDRRFNNRIRKFASITYTLDTILHTAMSQFIPALSLFQACGFPVFPTACVLSLTCYVYTALGGLKAVTWADGAQATIFMLCIIVLFIVGIIFAGGPMEVWQKANEGSRVEFFNWDPSLYIRYSMTNALLGSLLMMPSVALSPAFHQRVVSMPTYGQAKQVVMWSASFIALFTFFAFSMGIVVFAYFFKCDPVLARKGIKSYTEILPYFVSQISKTVPGLQGLFLSGIIAAGLSTTTSCWNSVSCTIYEDLVTPFLKPNVSTKTSLAILKGLVLLVAIISTAIIPILQNMKSIMEATLTIKAATISMYFVLYNGGMFFPWINSLGVLIGTLCSGVITLYVVVGSQIAKNQKLVDYYPKILTTSQCIANGTTMEALNMTTSIGTEGFGLVTKLDPSVKWIHKLSFMYFSLPGIAAGMLVALCVSFLVGSQDLSSVDSQMICPLMRWVLPKRANDSNETANENNDVPLIEYNVVSQINERP